MTTTQIETAPPDLEAAMGFLGRATTDLGSTAAVLLWALADELGVLAALAERPGTGADVAERTGCDPRSVEELTRGLVAAGYLEGAPGGVVSLPAAHAAVLVDGTPLSCSGGVQEVAAMASLWPQVARACRDGRGIDPSAYPPAMGRGMERLNGPAYEQALPFAWVPAVDGLEARLAAGGSVADVGCGHGRALLGLAAAHPGLRATGFDLSQASLEAAAALAEERGLAERVSFRRIDAGQGIPGSYDLVLAFDVLHDAGDPAALAAALRAATADHGVCLVLEPASPDDPAEAVGPVAALFQLFSVGYCLQVASHAGPARLGTCGLPEAALRDLLRRAGFSSVRRLPVEAGFNACFEARP